MIPPDRLSTFRRARSAEWCAIRLARGEPDLFLYKDDGSVMFIEAKMNDAVKEAQLRCLAQVRSILACPAEIVRVVEEGTRARPKTYSIEIDVPAPPSQSHPVVRRKSSP